MRERRPHCRSIVLGDTSSVSLSLSLSLSISIRIRISSVMEVSTNTAGLDGLILFEDVPGTVLPMRFYRSITHEGSFIRWRGSA